VSCVTTFFGCHICIVTIGVKTVSQDFYFIVYIWNFLALLSWSFQLVVIIQVTFNSSVMMTDISK